MKLLQRGFTLIELLIVIALIGVLAVGILAAINPLEQGRRGDDAKYKNTMAELAGAVQRFYTQRGYMPWCTLADTCNSGLSTQVAPITFVANAALSGNVVLDDLAGVGGNPAITNLSDSSEINTQFITATDKQLQNIFVSTLAPDDATAPNQMTLCFSPTSNSGKTDPQANKTIAGVADANCPSTDPADNCHFCIAQ